MSRPWQGSLEAKIADRIRLEGPLPFTEYMSEALYAPGLGYYANPNRDPSTDYYTAPAAHSAFGALLAIWAESLWRTMGRRNEFSVIEMGAGEGVLAQDFTIYAQNNLADFWKSLRYEAFDLYPRSRASSFKVLPNDKMPQNTEGIIIANELLDALPFHIFEVRGRKPMEVFVGIDGAGFKEIIGEPSSTVIEERLGSVLRRLPEGYRGEVSPYLSTWASQVDSTTKRGFVIVFDYGMERNTLYSPHRKHGTVLCFRQHARELSYLDAPGEKDITARVDFTEVRTQLAKKGFEHCFTMPQGEFLAALGLEDWLTEIHSMGLQEHARVANKAGIRKLLDKELFGGFTVSAFKKGVATSVINTSTTGRAVPLIKETGPHANILGTWAQFTD